MDALCHERVVSSFLPQNKRREISGNNFRSAVIALRHVHRCFTNPPRAASAVSDRVTNDYDNNRENQVNSLKC